MCVPPYKYREILGMLLKLIKLFVIIDEFIHNCVGRSLAKMGHMENKQKAAAKARAAQTEYLDRPAYTAFLPLYHAL